MNKVAVASRNGKVAQKLDKYSEFTIFYIDDCIPVSNEKICKKSNNYMLLTEYLLDMDISTLIVGSIREDIKSHLVANDIDVFECKLESIKKALEIYLDSIDGNNLNVQENSTPDVIYQ
ncbi:NifB/NifX family molybdenum-iron cluster-binding protein [Peptostreptococcus equinus]|uniref:Dinitrogenase iron-molybdenum cofactor biosynthesis domain-containing protein n=1 Tax=Peptostreptococcus equinus TaxID=3003601 RepID=A0ABY7JQV9_9FIRM|nr:NifB/NifX family molybdenum-iron cluster-binding protein [Peptostreptococcus sp. CBA3647]WAW14355.1 hypothetical protein O0R46_07030 [Peptostreptococcus sp. CBA3647]